MPPSNEQSNPIKIFAHRCSTASKLDNKAAEWLGNSKQRDPEESSSCNLHYAERFIGIMGGWQHLGVVDFEPIGEKANAPRC
jgi:hypothetical protein